MFFRRLLSSSAKNIAFAFDIDGVLLRGANPIQNAGKALALLNRERIPYVLLTNGGGTLEYERTRFISQQLQTQISPLQIVQSHTPFKTLVPHYRKILAVGTPSVRNVAQHYGFQNVVHPNDIVKYNPEITPYSGLSRDQLNKQAQSIEGLDTNPFDAILVFNDPRNWAADLQIISDLLLSETGMLNTLRSEKSCQPSIPIYFSNDDLLWANPYKLNRFGQGAFRKLVRTLYSSMNDGMTLNDHVLGKPTQITYDFAHHILIDWRNKLLSDTVDYDSLYTPESYDAQILPGLHDPVDPKRSPFGGNVFMVGDNPASDITGAQNYGWKSCLVKTGVYSPGDDLKELKPTMIVEDVYEAVTSALEKYT